MSQNPAPPLSDGRYQLVQRLGEGGMAVVYRAWDHRLKVDRAVKMLLPQYARRRDIRRRFETEATTMARLSHPSIVAVHDVGEEGDGGSVVERVVVALDAGDVALA